jgi:hypothetical protein
MFGASVPETSVDEHRYARRREHQVGTTPHARQREVDAIAQARSV